MLPFIFADTRMAPAGVRGIGAAMVDAGFVKTRIVLQQWNRNFKPSQMRVDGRIPDLFMVSSMGLHSGQCMELIRDCRRIDKAHRPLIIAGGPHAVYQPSELFGTEEPNSADVAVTGEEFVLMHLLETVLEMRAEGETMRSAFYRARDAGALQGIPGLMYARGPMDAPAEELVNTGVQRLVGDLDELPDPVLGYRLLEAPSRRATLASQPLEASRVRKLSPISSVVLTFGCKFNCPYCPIPAYNQRQHRLKSPGRIAEELTNLHKAYGLRYFFGADDNFFNHKQRTLDIVETLASAQIDGVRLPKKVRWHTEVTVHDTLLMKDHLPLIQKSGCRALWLGVEDMTATLVNKGQSVGKTQEAFGLLRDNGICPMPMMMHHDSQPLYSRGTNYGLLNQVKLLKDAGAVSLQVLMITPVGRDEAVRGHVHRRHGHQERERPKGRPAHVRRELRRRLEAGTPVAEAAQPADRVPVLLQPDPTGRHPGRQEDEGDEQGRRHAAGRHGRAVPHGPPHERVGGPADARQHRTARRAAAEPRRDAVVQHGAGDRACAAERAGRGAIGVASGRTMRNHNRDGLSGSPGTMSPPQTARRRRRPNANAAAAAARAADAGSGTAVTVTGAAV